MTAKINIFKQINDITVCMKVVVSRTAKKIISLHMDGSVLQVVANRKLTLQQIKNFVESKRSWILAQTKCGVNFCDETKSDLREKPSESNGLFTQNQISDIFCGKKCLLCGDLIAVKPSVESKCYLDDCIYLPERYYAQRDSRIKALNSYIKKLSQQSVSDAISRFGCNASLCPTKIEFKNVNGCWLKCTNPLEKVVTLDFRICQLPAKLQQYLIVHAFSHFTNDGHGEDFWNTVSNYLPHYKSYAEELKQYDFLKDVC